MCVLSCVLSRYTYEENERWVVETISIAVEAFHIEPTICRRGDFISSSELCISIQQHEPLLIFKGMGGLREGRTIKGGDSTPMRSQTQQYQRP